MGCVIAGYGKALPSLEVTNDELSRIVDTSDEWIRERTGIHARRIAVQETCTDLAVAACRQALERSEAADSSSIDLLVCMTVTPDAIIPSQAALVKAQLGLENAVAFDVNAACSGCAYGLIVAENMLRAANAQPHAHNRMRRALVVGVERLSRLVNWEDRATCVLFGDGAGAVLLEWRDHQPGIIASFMKNTDDPDRVLYTKNRLDCTSVPFAQTDVPEGLRPEHFITMEGQRVFKFATSAMAQAVESVLARGGCTLDDIALIVPHQANERIIRYAAKKLGLPLERFQISIQNTGNTSAASALIALADAYEQKRLPPGQKAILVAFGGGLTSAAVLFEA